MLLSWNENQSCNVHTKLYGIYDDGNKIKKRNLKKKTTKWKQNNQNNNDVY